MSGLEDFEQLPPELQQKLIEIEAAKPAARQLRVLQDIADISQELLNVVDQVREGGNEQSNNLGAVLLDVRESLNKLVEKEDPEVEIPDYAKPVVEAVGKLEKSITAALKKIDVKPEVTVDAPEVNVAPPDVDLQGIEKILKSEMPKAFDQAISRIEIPTVPQTDFTPVIDKLGELSGKLDSIDTASRMKPTFPSQFIATDTDGTSITAKGTLVPYAYDTILPTIGTTSEVYVYQLAGVTKATVTLTYTDSTKAVLSSVVRT